MTSHPISAGDLLQVTASFTRTRWNAWRLRSREDVLAHQSHHIEKFLRETVAKCEYYRDMGVSTLPLLPQVDKRTLLADFAKFNSAGITVSQVRTVLGAGSDRIGGYAVGQSTGTSGNRGYYVVSDAERFKWLGVILAKTLPDALWQKHRVALALPGLSTLYSTASTGSRIKLGFFDLARGVDAWSDELLQFMPDTIVAPPKVLRYLAQLDKLRVKNIFSGAEVLDPLDRSIIENATGVRVREIYMATEGLLGVACPHGTLHLAEDVMHFEWDRCQGSRLYSPLITDFTRQVQVMARYRINDLLELSDKRCSCGSPLQAISRIEGRQDDVFLISTLDGTLRTLTPDVLRNAVVDSDYRIDDFRIIQKDSRKIEIRIHPNLPSDVSTKVQTNFLTLLVRMKCEDVEVSVERGLPIPFDRKLRRVYRDWNPPTNSSSA